MEDKKQSETEEMKAISDNGGTIEKATQPDTKLIKERLKLERAVNSGAACFMFIVALSLLNSMIYWLGGQWSFLIGLGITQLIDAIAKVIGGTAADYALVLDILVVLPIIGLGILAKKRHGWAFLVGMVLYGLDALLTLLFRDILSTAFHLFFLYSIYKGLRASRRLTTIGK